MIGRIIVIAATASCTTAAWAESGQGFNDSGDPIDIGGIYLFPSAQPGAWRMHPFAWATAGWDSNPQQVADGAEADSYFGAQGGVQVDWDSPTALFRAYAQGGYIDYQDSDDQDRIPIESRVAWRRDLELSGHELVASFVQEERPDATTAFEGERRDYDLTGHWWRQGRFRTMKLSLGGRIRDYQSDGDPRNGNQDYLQGRATADYLPSGNGDHRWGWLGRVTWTEYTRSDSLAQDGLALELLASWLHEMNERSRLLIRGGAEVGWYADDYASDSDYGDEVFPWPAGEISWRYQLGPNGSELDLTARSALVPGERSNGRGLIGTEASADLRPNRRLRYDAELSLAHRRDSGANAGSDPVTTTTGSLDTGVTYFASRSIGIRLGWEWRENLSNRKDFEYAQHILSLGGAGAF